MRGRSVQTSSRRKSTSDQRHRTTEAERRPVHTLSRRHAAAHIGFVEFHALSYSLFELLLVRKGDGFIARVKDVREVLKAVSQVVRYKQIAVNFEFPLVVLAL